MPTTLAGPAMDAASRTWLERLGPGSPEREAAIAELHALLLRATRFEVGRRGARDAEDLARQSADDALMAILRKIGDFRGDSRFTTWAYKFALYEAAVAVRRRAWQGREVVLEPESWDLFRDGGPGPDVDAERRELLAALRDAIRQDLTPHQRAVLVAVALDGVPIDVLAERLATTRGALYKPTHDARRKLRAALAARGLETTP